MSNKYVGAAKFGYQKVVKPAVTAIKKTFSKKSPTITSIRPGTDLTTKRAIQDKTVKAVDEGTRKGIKEAAASETKLTYLTTDQKRKINQKKSKMKRDESKKLKGVSYEYDKLTKKFAKTKANIEKKKKIKTVAGATAVGSGTAAAGLIGKKIKDKRVKKMGGGMMGRRFGYKGGELVGNQKKIDVAPPFGEITGEDLSKLRQKRSMGGGAGQTRKEKILFKLNKNIKNVKEKMKGPTLTKSSGIKTKEKLEPLRPPPPKKTSGKPLKEKP